MLCDFLGWSNLSALIALLSNSAQYFILQMPFRRPSIRALYNSSLYGKSLNSGLLAYRLWKVSCTLIGPVEGVYYPSRMSCAIFFFASLYLQSAPLRAAGVFFFTSFCFFAGGFLQDLDFWIGAMVLVLVGDGCRVWQSIWSMHIQVACTAMTVWIGNAINSVSARKRIVDNVFFQRILTTLWAEAFWGMRWHWPSLVLLFKSIWIQIITCIFFWRLWH